MANLAAANMMHRKTRTLVSVLAVAVEVAMVMVLVGLANGTLGDIANRLENVGADVLFQPPDASLILGATSAVMPIKFIEIMKREVPEVAEVTPVLNWHVSKIKGNTQAVNMWAVDYASYALISGGHQIVEGHGLRDAGDVVVDTLLARTTGLTVGESVPLMGREFHVAGIFRAGAGGRFYARIQDVQDAMGTPDKASFFLVKARRPGQAEELARALQDKFKGYKVTPVAQVSAAMQQNTVGLQEFKKALTGMALMISFLVVLLAMYTAIIERTREIGILRAIGATRARVVQLIVTESLLICLAGIAAGILLSFGIKELFVHLLPTQIVNLTLPWAAVASALGLVGGLLGSFYPALRAAQLDPVQALNFE
jgi:putative ABC transport system permease protein